MWCVRGTTEEAKEEARGVRGEATTLVRRKKLAVFVSGGGSNLKSIHEASLKGSLRGDVLVLVTNKTGMYASNPTFFSTLLKRKGLILMVYCDVN